MDKIAVVNHFWYLFDRQDWDGLKRLFHPECKIAWPNTSDDFTPEEYISLNRKYPGSWKIEVEDVIEAKTKAISVVRIKSKDSCRSLRGIGFFTFEDGLIYHLLEYFAPDTHKPDWRSKKCKTTGLNHL
ncbi:MAG: nuclear transport factor 2 family protein [Candidatus Izemoplasmatales bacterium]|jgi:hypothetical protein